MNRVVVSQTASGIARWLKKTEAEGPVVIGYDGRKNSDVFARDSAEILSGAGLKVVLLPRKLPTPVLAFAVQYFGASAGIMVTASHNPPNDNGYKVYLGSEAGGGQIVPPIDEDIARKIDKAAREDIREYPRAEDYYIADEDVVDAYVAATAKLVEAQAAPLNWVYTAMHGVGWRTTKTLLEVTGFDAPVTVDEQLFPDPLFSTVAFPNPEEPGALDLAFAAADKHGAELIIAHDPDADRLGVAIPSGNPSPKSPEDAYRRLSGNEVGMILGWEIAKRRAASTESSKQPGTMAVSLVSSPALSRVAAKFGLDYVETPTGFKWIVQTPNLVFGYEEALGYLVQPNVVSDKDGISASLLLLDIAAKLKVAGKTLADNLEDFAAEFGYFASDQVSFRFDDVSEIARIMARLRTTPLTEIGGSAVVNAEDLLLVLDDAQPADILRYQLEDGSRIIARPSGTEPKLKVYLDVSADEGSYAEKVAAARVRLDELAASIRELFA